MDDLPRNADVVFVGAGRNALVAAAYLLDAGRSVVLLKQMAHPGGWVRTDELGAPGFHHDRWSALHPAFTGGPVWAELGPDLTRHGLEYVTAPSRPGHVTCVTPQGGDGRGTRQASPRAVTDPRPAARAPQQPVHRDRKRAEAPISCRAARAVGRRASQSCSPGSLVPPAWSG